MNSAFFVALRQLRAPLIALIAIFSISIVGLVLIPGVDASGKPWRMDFFHALYFISYTATTIGFGETPYPFNDAQRLWVTFCIFLTVIGWAYAIGSLLRILQGRRFQNAVTAQQFELAVQRMAEPFYLVCGYGDTGQLLCRSLDHLNLGFVVIDSSPERIDELDLQDYRADAPGLAADARLPGNLLLAGLTHRLCLGVVTLTNDDAVNLAVAIAVRLLRPDIPALCRVTTAKTAANMASFGTRHIIDPFETFGEYFALAVRSPGSYQLLEWLTGSPGTTLTAERVPPHGRWIICGYGRFGQAVVRHLAGEPVEVTLIEPKSPPMEGPLRWIVGEGTCAETLREAGVEQAVGIVAGTDDDINNLSIVVTARELNPELFVVLRQNLQANRELFQAFDSNFTVVPGEVVAHECLAILTTPLLSRFLAMVKRKDDAWADGVVARLSDELGREVPTVWRVVVEESEAPALVSALRGGGVDLEVLWRDSSDRERKLPCVPLMAVRGDQELDLPGADFPVREGDQFLFAGIAETMTNQQLILRNANVLDYVLRGQQADRGWLWRKLAARAPAQ